MVELWLPKNGHKGRDANNSLKWGGMPKMGAGHKWWGYGKCLLWNGKICFAKIRIKRIY